MMTTPTTGPALGPNGSKPATANRSIPHLKAYVGEAHPREMPDVTACLTRGFASTLTMNLYSSVTRLVMEVDADAEIRRRTCAAR